MFSVFGLCLIVLVPYVTTQQTGNNGNFRNEKAQHESIELSDGQISSLASLTNITHMNETLDNICIVRVVGTDDHRKVKDYLKNSMRNLDWTVESDVFDDETPNVGTLEFENIIAKLNPDARRYLTLACHYDSLNTIAGDFLGATDSAVPCSQLLNLATVMRDQLNSAKTSNVSLMFIFFDGEEAFKRWGPQDSTYGSRHLASKWHGIQRTFGNETDITDLDKMDMLVLLDLLGASNPVFYNYMSETDKWYTKLVQTEQSLARLGKFDGHYYDSPQKPYFRQDPVDLYIEDDHIPFLAKNVPILHLIPVPFPSFWHTSGDNRTVIDLDTTENLNKIFRVFVASYLNLTIS